MAEPRARSRFGFGRADAPPVGEVVAAAQRDPSHLVGVGVSRNGTGFFPNRDTISVFLPEKREKWRT